MLPAASKLLKLTPLDRLTKFKPQTDRLTEWFLLLHFAAHKHEDRITGRYIMILYIETSKY